MNSPGPQKSPDPERFQVSRATLWFDRMMGIAIRFGGIGVILAVFGIFFFIGREVVPLFGSATIAPAGKVAAGAQPAVLGISCNSL